MNVANMIRLRDHLATLQDDQVKMNDWLRVGHCGTVACIAGWSFVLVCPDLDYNLYMKQVDENRAVHPEVVATEWLDLSQYEANHLFMGRWMRGPLGSITRQQVIDHLSKLIGDA